MNHPLYIMVNPHCHQGQGWKRWQSIREPVLQRLPEAQVLVTESKDDLHQRLETIFLSGEETGIISAGGDGSINELINFVMKLNSENRSLVSIGAIGLGSSNDFLKPFESYIKHVPVKINTEIPARLYDVGLADFINDDNIRTQQYFIVNASMGVTAVANWEFNHPDIILKALKKHFTLGAILYAAVRTILGHRNIDCSMIRHDKEESMAMSNINILKNPNVSGSFRYPQDIRHDDGLLGINICKDMDWKELLSTLSGLSKGKFETGNKRISIFSDSFHLVTTSPVILECDGETMKAGDIFLSVLPKAIKIYN